MNYGQNDKTVILFNDPDVTAAETQSGYVDTQDFDYAIIEVLVGTADDPTSNFSTLTLSEGLVSNAFTAIATFTGDDTTNGFVIPVADSSNPQVVVRMNVRLDKRERYLKLEAAPTVAQAVLAVAHLSYKDETPTSVSDLGVGVTRTG